MYFYRHWNFGFTFYTIVQNMHRRITHSIRTSRSRILRGIYLCLSHRWHVINTLYLQSFFFFNRKKDIRKPQIIELLAYVKYERNLKYSMLSAFDNYLITYLTSPICDAIYPPRVGEYIRRAESGTRGITGVHGYLHTHVKTHITERMYRCTVARVATRSSAFRACRRGLLHEWFSDQSFARVHDGFLAYISLARYVRDSRSTIGSTPRARRNKVFLLSKSVGSTG